jgi:predicted GH43/DUF377 family glycosyl hydrolase
MAIDEVLINIGDKKYRLSASCSFVRFEGNPILSSSQVNKKWNEPHLKVVTVHNAGVAIHNKMTMMLFRSHLRNGISVIGKAISRDGLTDWHVDYGPALKPCDENDIFAANSDIDAQIEMEAGGVEDPRISRIGEKYYITYSAYHGMVEDRVRVCLASTDDFITFLRHGPILDRDMRNVVIFPEKIGRYFYALMRPNDDPSSGQKGGIFKEIRLARTEALESNVWDVYDEPVMRQGGGPSPFQHKIGPGAPPIKTRHGWLSIFHGVRSTMDGNPYVLGVALHDLDDPSKVKVSSIPVVFPTKDDCKVGPKEYVHVPQVVFTCGAIRNDNGMIRIYYGGNDTVMNVGFSHEDILAAMCKQYPQDPLTGKPLYKI